MRSKPLLAALFLGAAFSCAQPVNAESKVSAEAKSAFAAGDYSKAIEILNREAASSPGDAAVQLLLARCYFESEDFDRAVAPAEAAISLEPRNSEYHELLGRIYGEKADRSGWLSALSLLRVWGVVVVLLGPVWFTHQALITSEYRVTDVAALVTMMVAVAALLAVAGWAVWHVHDPIPSAAVPSAQVSSVNHSNSTSVRPSKLRVRAVRR